jgi:hypothetical protein
MRVAAGNQLVQQLKTLAVEFPRRIPGYIAARTHQAVGKALLDESRPGNHDDRYRRRLGTHRQRI